MKKSKLLLTSLLSLALVVTGCSKETTKVNEGKTPVGTVNGTDKDDKPVKEETYSKLQDLYETLKTSSGGSVALDYLLKEIAKNEYKYVMETEDSAKTFEEYGIKAYRTKKAFLEDIEDNLETQIDSSNYENKRGKFDEDKFVEYVEDEGYTVDKEENSTHKYEIDVEGLTYNYDEYIDETIVPDLYLNYLYEDYVLGVSKYWTTIRNQYGIQMQVLKFENYTTAQNSAFSESLRADVNAVLTGANKEASFTFNKSNNALYSFTTSDSDDNLIVFEAPLSGTVLRYTVYKNNEKIDKVLDALYDREISRLSDWRQGLTGSKVYDDAGQEITNSSVTATEGGAEVLESYEINKETTPDDEKFFEAIEKISIARKLYVIDTEVAMARNYDLKNETYEAYRPSQKDNAETFASTYSSSNTRTIKEGARVSKMSAEDLKYYEENQTYTRETYGSVIPSAISALRGTNTRELMENLKSINGVNYLLPNKEDLDTPIYADGDYYYVVKVNGYYGYFASQDYQEGSGEEAITRTATQNSPNYQIEAFQEGAYTVYKYNEESHRFVAEEAKVSYDSTFNSTEAADAKKEWDSIIDMCQTIANKILSNTHRTEAVVEIFKKYKLEINDQEIYDYIENSYPDYFED